MSKKRNNQILDSHSIFALTILEKKNNLAIYTRKRKEEAKVKLTNTQLKKIKFAGKI